MDRRRFIYTLVLCALVSACSKPLEGSVEGLNKVVAAITAKDKAAFTQAVVPDQRAKPGFDPTVVVDKEIAALATPDILDIAFFADATKITVDPDTLSDKTDSTVGIMTMFHHSSGSFAARSRKARKVGSEWLLDVKATIEGLDEQQAADGVRAVYIMAKTRWTEATALAGERDEPLVAAVGIFALKQGKARQSKPQST
jgi:hypothetical protein